MYAIANTGATLNVGQERSTEKTALTVDPRCRSHSSCTIGLMRVTGYNRSFWISQPPFRWSPAEL
jgi:hypothetical protein